MPEVITEGTDVGITHTSIFITSPHIGILTAGH